MFHLFPALLFLALSEPQPFGPGPAAIPENSCPTFAPDGRTVYLVRHSSTPTRLMVSRLVNGEWTAAEPLSFSGPASGRLFDFDPALSPDGSRLFFVSRQRKEDPAQIWMVERRGVAWSEPAIAADGFCGTSVAADGTLYFCGPGPAANPKPDIYSSRLVNGKYAAPRNLGDVVNTSAAEFDTYIAPDQSYLIFTSDRPRGANEGRFYISVRRGDTWTAPRNLGPLGDGACPVVSPDRKYFYFTRGNKGIFSIPSGELGIP